MLKTLHILLTSRWRCPSLSMIAASFLSEKDRSNAAVHAVFITAWAARHRSQRSVSSTVYKPLDSADNSMLRAQSSWLPLLLRPPIIPSPLSLSSLPLRTRAPIRISQPLPFPKQSRRNLHLLISFSFEQCIFRRRIHECGIRAGFYEQFNRWQMAVECGPVEGCVSWCIL